jgi:hypothetical protein
MIDEGSRTAKVGRRRPARPTGESTLASFRISLTSQVASFAMQAGQLLRRSLRLRPSLCPGAPGPAGCGCPSPLRSGAHSGASCFNTLASGATVSDAIEAGALQAFGTVQHRAFLATAAGLDLVPSDGHVSEGEKAMDVLSRAYQNDRLSRSAFRESAQRVISLHEPRLVTIRDFRGAPAHVFRATPRASHPPVCVDPP